MARASVLGVVGVENEGLIHAEKPNHAEIRRRDGESRGPSVG
jgi:hypothetical protein